MSKERGFVVWFTGLSGSGKSTLAAALAPELRERGLNVEVLDGDTVRTNLSKGLGFSREDRDANILRIGFVANLLARNGVAVVTAAISPYRETRDAVRRLVEGDGCRFVEVYAGASLEECEARDVKGLYAEARAGKRPGLTGIDDPYEEPLSPEVHLCTAGEPIQQSLSQLVGFLELEALVPRAPAEREPATPGGVR